MKLLSKIFVLSTLMSTLAFADPCPEHEYCYSVDMKSVQGAYKETLCTETEHHKQCVTAVWVPVGERILIDLNSFQIDEEDVFINYKILYLEIPYAARYMYPDAKEIYEIERARFDCERAFYKPIYSEIRTKQQLITHQDLEIKPGPIHDEWLRAIYNRACMAHNALTKD